jgi:hypothetical protein
MDDGLGVADLTRIEQGFTEDAVTRFTEFPAMRVRNAIMQFLRARFGSNR